MSVKGAKTWLTDPRRADKTQLIAIARVQLMNIFEAAGIPWDPPQNTAPGRRLGTSERLYEFLQGVSVEVGHPLKNTRTVAANLYPFRKDENATIGPGLVDTVAEAYRRIEEDDSIMERITTVELHCEECDREFPTPTALRRHRQFTHGAPVRYPLANITPRDPVRQAARVQAGRDYSVDENASGRAYQAMHDLQLAHRRRIQRRLRKVVAQLGGGRTAAILMEESAIAGRRVSPSFQSAHRSVEHLVNTPTLKNQKVWFWEMVEYGLPRAEEEATRVAADVAAAHAKMDEQPVTEEPVGVVVEEEPPRAILTVEEAELYAAEVEELGQEEADGWANVRAAEAAPEATVLTNGQVIVERETVSSVIDMLLLHAAMNNTRRAEAKATALKLLGID